MRVTAKVKQHSGLDDARPVFENARFEITASGVLVIMKFAGDPAKTHRVLRVAYAPDEWYRVTEEDE